MEDFIPFELAVKLKEKGFNLNTELRYVKKIEGSEREEWDEESCNWVTKYSVNIYPKPTISQVLKWLRMEKKISMEIGIHYSLKWMCSIYGFSDGIADFTQYDNDSIDDTIYILYDSYEQATLAGIEYVLDNVI